ncbi:fungal-specific transcription factor domain-containing protein [Podospora aff. communis PSN243]|uniref:Fungal-specific transcription factor domain-containing protein n=1 Tax=Podospora aff. communis PSN243 TaxID=3040156 RepID=A0AAV9GXP5_9PEZI|nr:fungal-specific transcription factor domain-containing protein [Podospora aff. communis PSN243]
MEPSPAPTTLQSAPSIASSSSSKAPRILACVLCQHRKIKCDRHFPCANCTKANVKCTPSTPAPARKRRRPNQDLQERLARCEELLKEYATEKPDDPATTPGRREQAPLYDDPKPKWQPAGKLVQEDGGVRFIDNFLIGTVYDELRAMRQIVETDEPEETSPESATPDDHSELILGADTPEQDVEDLWPQAGQVFRLWQVYLDRVNPLTKIIHVPTLQPYLAEAITRSPNVPKSVEALLFSIFLMAAIALTPDECQGLLGQSREEALQRYSKGVRLTLLRMNFLKSNDLNTLQALVIYLISLQGRYNRHAAWILNGIVIRMAQKMGLHRDGELLGLGPFDTEMRRRVWWQIIMVDAKYAMFSGLSHTLLPRNWDTKAPKNVNDADIYPSATEPFQDRDGPTEMIFCLLTYKFAKFMVDNPGLEQMLIAPQTADMQDTPGALSEDQAKKYRHTCEMLGKELIEMLDKYCDPQAGPVHEMAIAMRKFIVDKIQELITPPKLQKEFGTEVRNSKDNTFKIAVATLEHNEQNYMSSKDRGFIWFSLLHFQPDIFLYMAGQLCHRTEGNLVERAWRQVEVVFTFHPELFDVSNKTYSTIAIFILKAWRKREETVYSRTGHPPETPFYIEKLRASMPNDDYKTEPTPPNPYTPASLVEAQEVDATGFDQFLGGLLDVPQLEWDMFAGAPVNGGNMPSFGMYGLGGPPPEW